jgi:hypothetical protein
MIACSGSIGSMNANVRKLAMKKFLLTSVAALFLATGAARADDESDAVLQERCKNGATY